MALRGLVVRAAALARPGVAARQAARDDGAMRRLAAAAFMVLAPLAQAELYTGTRLLAELNAWERTNDKGTSNAREAWEGGQGFGYVAGVVDALLPRLCIPPTVTDIQIARVVLKFMRENPSLHHWSGDSMVVGAVSQAWPCPAKR